MIENIHNIAKTIMQYTADHSNFDTHRNYVSLSHSSLPEMELLKTYTTGFEDSLHIRLRCYKGYQMERDLLARIFASFPVSAKPAAEISAFDGMVKGHPDFEFAGYPADTKSVPLDKYLPEHSSDIPRKVFYQMQAYMMYGAPGAKALVIYESRETGLIRDYWLSMNPRVQNDIHSKLKNIVNHPDVLRNLKAA